MSRRLAPLVCARLANIFMWQQNYTPLAGNLPLSALVSAIPIFTFLVLLAILRKPAWISSLAGLATAALVSAVAYGMPLGKLASATVYGAAYGLFPIGWVIFASILIFRITVDSGKFEILKDSIGHITTDARLQTLLIAFAFSAFIEGASGFGTPVPVAAAMLTGLGFSPFYAAAICLLGNTAPVSYGAMGTPTIALAVTTGLPLEHLCATIGRICAPLAFLVAPYLIVVLAGWKGLRGVWPAVLVCGLAFATTLTLVANTGNVQTPPIVAAFVSVGALMILLHFWKPKDKFAGSVHHSAQAPTGKRPSVGALLLAWSPYILLIAFVLVWGVLQTRLNRFSLVFPWPGLHNAIQRMPPVVDKPSGYAAKYTFNLLSTPGTACILAGIVAAFVVGLKPRQLATVVGRTAKQLALAELTLAAVLALAFVMNYSGMTATLGLAAAATGALFPVFSPLLGFLGVFLTGSDTSANALFGNLQVVTAGRLHLNPILMAAANSAGGSTGKLISLTSIAVAAAATNLKRHEEAMLFRFTIKHAVILTAVLAVIVVFFAYVEPGWVG